MYNKIKVSVKKGKTMLNSTAVLYILQNGYVLGTVHLCI